MPILISIQYAIAIICHISTAGRTLPFALKHGSELYQVITRYYKWQATVDTDWFV